MKRHCPYEKAHLPLALKNKPRPHLYRGRGYHVEVYVSQQLRMYIFTLCTYLKLHTPLVQIYLNNRTSFISNLFRFIFIRTPFRGLTRKIVQR